MPRIYTSNFDGVAVSAAQDLFGIYNTSTPKFVKLLRVKIACSNVTLATGQMLDYNIRQFIGATITAGTSGTTSGTINKTDPGDAAQVGFTTQYNNTGVATTTGTNTLLMADSFHLFNGLDETFTGEPSYPDACQPMFVPAVATATTQAILIRLVNAPTGTVNLSGTIWVQEIG